METTEFQALAQLIRTQRLAALGTLREGAPSVSMVLYNPAPDLTACDLHLSRLALHTQDMVAQPMVGLMIVEPEAPARNPLTLRRVSLQGEAALLATDSPAYAEAKAAYLARFPFAAINFTLADFDLFRVTLHGGRYVAGFGQVFDLTADDLRQAGASQG